MAYTIVNVSSIDSYVAGLCCPVLYLDDSDLTVIAVLIEDLNALLKGERLSLCYRKALPFLGHQDMDQQSQSFAVHSYYQA